MSGGESYAVKLKRLRRFMKWTQEIAAKELGCCSKTISRIEGDEGYKTSNRSLLILIDLRLRGVDRMRSRAG